MKLAGLFIRGKEEKPQLASNFDMKASNLVYILHCKQYKNSI
jgi:hypothetical protein